MQSEQYASEAVAYLVAMAMDKKTENYHLEAACGKVFASECAWRCVDETIQIMGGMGYMFEQVSFIRSFNTLSVHKLYHINYRRSQSNGFFFFAT